MKVVDISERFRISDTKGYLKVLLHDVENIQHITTIIKWKDGRTAAGWSTISYGELLLHTEILKETIRQYIFGDLEDDDADNN